MRQTVVVVMLLGVFALASVAHGANYYISPFGSDSNSGTSSHSPFLTMSKALSASSTGDTINAASGYYTGSDNVGLTITDRTVVGASTSGTVFQTDSGTVFTVAGTTYLNNLTLKGSQSSSIGISMSSSAVSSLEDVDFTSLNRAITLGSNTANLTVSDCLFGNTVNYGIQYSSGGSTVFWENIIIKKSTFNTADYSLYIVCGDADYLDQITVTDSVFTSSPAYIEWYYGADLTSFQGCDFANITRPGNGGALYIKGRSAFEFDDCVFSACSADGGGGAMYFLDDTTTQASSLSVTNCRFINNTADFGGALYVYGAPLTVSDSLFALNNASSYGALYVDPYYNDAAACSIDSSVFIGNYASSGNGGALQLNFGAGEQPSSTSNSVFAFNTCEGDGGAVVTGSGTYSFSSVSFIGNSAASGGALSIGSSATVSGSALNVLGNMASDDGGGVDMGNDSTFTVSGASFSSNVAEQDGGAINMGTATLSLQYVSLSKNDAANGGGFYTSGTAAANIFGARLQGNDATTSGGGFYCGGGGVNLGFVSISGNDAPQGSAYTCAGSCGTYTTNVYLASNNDVYGCSSGSDGTTADEVEAMAAAHLAQVPTLTWEEAAAMLADYR